MDSQSEKGQILAEFLVWATSLSLFLIALYHYETRFEHTIKKHQFGKGNIHAQKTQRTRFK